MLKFLLDTHTLLWTLYEPHKLPTAVLAVVRKRQSELFISHVSPWEITDKATKFRLPMAGSSPASIVRDVQALGATLVPITLEDIVASVKLPRHHNDPLDRVLIAQAQRLGATLLSKDGKFTLYEVPILWS